MDHLGQGMEKGKRGALVNEFPFATVDSIDEQQQRTDEEMAMSKKLDMFLKRHSFRCFAFDSPFLMTSRSKSLSFMNMSSFLDIAISSSVRCCCSSIESTVAKGNSLTSAPRLPFSMPWPRWSMFCR
ncbi:MAG: hypothetical protein AAFP15_20325 [Bacteroidota bacterium]